VSTNIQSGFRLSGIRSVSEVNDWLERQRKVSMQESERRYQDAFAKNLAKILDIYRYFEEDVALNMIYKMFPPEERPLRLAAPADDFCYLADRLIQSQIDAASKDQIKTRCLYLGMEVALFFVEDQVLGIPLTRSDALERTIKSQPEYESFGYWNSTCADESVSKEDWAERERLWDVAIPGAGTIKHYGLIATLSPQELPDCAYNPNWQQILNRIPDRDSRLARFAQALVEQKYCDHYDAQRKTSGEEFRLSKVVDIVDDVRKNLTTTYQAEYREIRERFESCVPLQYTMGDIRA